MNPATTGTQPFGGAARAAHLVLRHIFGAVRPGIRYRLWDGSEGTVGDPDGSFTIVIRDPQTFRQAFSSQNTKVLAEAFVDGRVDVEGDLFACLRIGNQLDEVQLGWRDKVSLWRALRRVAP